jgi:hypothetical protein
MDSLRQTALITPSGTSVCQLASRMSASASSRFFSRRSRMSASGEKHPHARKLSRPRGVRSLGSFVKSHETGAASAGAPFSFASSGGGIQAASEMTIRKGAAYARIRPP